jgi:hypothetical protein
MSVRFDTATHQEQAAKSQAHKGAEPEGIALECSNPELIALSELVEALNYENLLLSRGLEELQKSNDGLRDAVYDLKTLCIERISAIEKKHREEIAGLTSEIVFDRKRISKLEGRPKETPADPLKEELFSLLESYYEKAPQGVPISKLYNKTLGARSPRRREVRGILDISKTTASRLKEACKEDKRFKVETVRGKEVIRLNKFIK